MPNPQCTDQDGSLQFCTVSANEHTENQELSVKAAVKLLPSQYISYKAFLTIQQFNRASLQILSFQLTQKFAVRESSQGEAIFDSRRVKGILAKVIISNSAFNKVPSLCSVYLEFCRNKLLPRPSFLTFAVLNRFLQQKFGFLAHKVPCHSYKTSPEVLYDQTEKKQPRKN